MNIDEVRQKLLEIVTYHSDDGTSGYLLDEERIKKIMKLIKKGGE